MLGFHNCLQNMEDAMAIYHIVKALLNYFRIIAKEPQKICLRIANKLFWNAEWLVDLLSI